MPYAVLFAEIFDFDDDAGHKTRDQRSEVSVKEQKEESRNESVFTTEVTEYTEIFLSKIVKAERRK